MTIDLEELDAILALEPSVCFPDLEILLTSSDYFGLETATALQRAICRIIQGKDLGDLRDHPDVIEALNGATVPPGVPLEVVIVAAIRTAKSMIAAATAIRATQTVDLSPMLDSGGEVARYSVLSLSLDNATDVRRHVLAALRKPLLSQVHIDAEDMAQDAESKRWVSLLKRTGGTWVGSEFLRHPSGRPIEIRIVAGRRAGGSVVSKWSAGCCLDEAPRMVGASEGVINLDDVRRAVIGRLLPGAQLLMIGSPWQANGPVYEMVQKEWGRSQK